MDFHDFPMILGKSGKYEIQPPELCASLLSPLPGRLLRVPALELLLAAGVQVPALHLPRPRRWGLGQVCCWSLVPAVLSGTREVLQVRSAMKCVRFVEPTLVPFDIFAHCDQSSLDPAEQRRAVAVGHGTRDQ